MLAKHPRLAGRDFLLALRIPVAADPAAAFAAACAADRQGVDLLLLDEAAGGDPLTLAAALAPATEQALLVTALDPAGGMHPLHVAKYGATVHHMSGGRWGLLLRAGAAAALRRMAGRPDVDATAAAREFAERFGELLRLEENLTVAGEHFAMRDAFVSPKPAADRPILLGVDEALAAGIAADFLVCGPAAPATALPRLVVAGPATTGRPTGAAGVVVDSLEALARWR